MVHELGDLEGMFRRFGVLAQEDDEAKMGQLQDLLQDLTTKQLRELWSCDVSLPLLTDLRSAVHMVHDCAFDDREMISRFRH